MGKVKRTAKRIKNHWDRHWLTYGFAVLAVSAVVLQQRNLREFYKFLEEKGIDPKEYYNPEYFQELNKGKAA